MPLAAGSRVGVYCLVAPLGQGGMGAVWRAARDGDDYRHEVAIKFVREGLSDGLLDRFRRERQILAQLNHPNIARILDGGTVDDQPYLVMELIDGHPLVEYALKRQLPLRERIRIFRMVCDAVQYAHQHLVVHRDLKPGNILVTADGTPKLLDFGIAKILAEQNPETAATQTLTGFLAMTPDYASPEQVRGEPVSTASDIYSLGAVLYELLTGTRPHALTTYDPAELVQKICNTDTMAPSRRGHPALRGDLDNIVLKAMQKDPGRRYVSADQLAEDLRRYLEGLPVLARPDTFGYRMTKYARRHKWGLAAVAAVILALSAGLLLAARQARIASQRFEMVRSLADKFVFDVHDEIARVDGSLKARQLLVSTGLQYLDQLSASAGNDRALLEDLVKAYSRIGDVQGLTGSANLGEPAAAAVSYQKAADIAGTLYRKDPVKYAYTFAGAEVSLAKNLADREKDEDARRHLNRSIELAKEVEKRDPQNENVQVLLGSIESNSGMLYYQSLRMREAFRDYEAAEQRFERIAARNPSSANRRRLASAAVQLAGLKQIAGELEAARGLLETARLIREDDVNRNPQDSGVARQEAYLYQLLNGLCFVETRPHLDNAEEGWKWRQKSTEITRRLTAKDLNNADAKDMRSADAGASGLMLALLGRGKEAVPVLEEALALTRELMKRTPGIHYYDTRESMIVRWLAWSANDLPTADEAVALAERDWKSEPSSLVGQIFVVNTYRVQAHVAAARGYLASARAALDQAGAIADKWPASPGHEMFLAHSLSNYYQSRIELAHAEKNAAAEREWLEKIGKLWREWPEQSSYTRARQAKPLLNYPW